MTFIMWNDDLSVGVKEIDEQHKKLVKIINELYDCMLDGKEQDVTGKILSDLIDYTTYHFNYEEKLFSSNGYPESETHIKMHKYFINQVLLNNSTYLAGKKTISLDLMTLLKDWLINHVIKTDKMYGPFLNSKGIF